MLFLGPLGAAATSRASCQSSGPTVPANTHAEPGAELQGPIKSRACWGRVHEGALDRDPFGHRLARPQTGRIRSSDGGHERYARRGRNQGQRDTCNTLGFPLMKSLVGLLDDDRVQRPDDHGVRGWHQGRQRVRDRRRRRRRPSQTAVPCTSPAMVVTILRLVIVRRGLRNDQFKGWIGRIMVIYAGRIESI